MLVSASRRNDLSLYDLTDRVRRELVGFLACFSIVAVFKVRRFSYWDGTQKSGGLADGAL
ncbi:MAG: hypothetical protein DME53_13770 [Verrucomicrobia bacterium]|nr:MAG: hypothetical protein DME56_13565 [Verrucomicrobiota bacterium]PYK42981.1 MAG: hypothetical protein DME53_13770 [Verrucomicrobiota bacterium]